MGALLRDRCPRYKRGGADVRRTFAAVTAEGCAGAGKAGGAISTGMWLEYEEVIVRYAGRASWERVARIFGLIEQLHGNVLHIEPSFHFHLITADADDDVFADCAIAAEVDWIITEDAHFNTLKSSGYKPRPITPTDFIAQFLSGL